MDRKRRVFFEKSACTSAKQFSEYSLKWDNTALLSCNLPNLQNLTLNNTDFRHFYGREEAIHKKINATDQIDTIVKTTNC